MDTSYFMFKINEVLITSCNEIHSGNTSPFYVKDPESHTDRKKLSGCQELGGWGPGV